MSLLGKHRSPGESEGLGNLEYCIKQPKQPKLRSPLASFWKSMFTKWERIADTVLQQYVLHFTSTIYISCCKD